MKSGVFGFPKWGVPPREARFLRRVLAVAGESGLRFSFRVIVICDS